MNIYNSLTRKKEKFTPIKKGRIGMYVCGPTVYDEPHIGHARSAYIFDVIRRYLQYKEYKVTFVRNVTDVDDKIIEKAIKVTRSQGYQVTSLKEAALEVSKKYLGAYHEDMELLGIGKPDKEPKATEYIPKMIKFIQVLLDKGAAYSSGGDVYFDIGKARGYGKLSNQNLEKMEAGARIAPGENKKDPMDFALWKKAKDDEPSWESPWGRGRPGWHIECSVMSSDILGGEFDIHGGGIDLIFPHHENEIAQSEGAGKKFARYWIHNGLLTIEGEKMAKSLGNFISIKDFMKEYKDADYLKLLFLNTHYRHPVDYTKEKISEMKREKERFVILLKKIDQVAKGRQVTGSPGHQSSAINDFRDQFEMAMNDDFNTPLALAALFGFVTHMNKYMQGKDSFTKDETAQLAGMKKLLMDLSSIFALDLSSAANEAAMSEKEISKLIEARNAARKDKDFKKADDIRKTLSDKGIILEDTKDGTEWRVKV